MLWWSTSNRPDLGGRESDDNRLLTDFEEDMPIVQNKSGYYPDISIELSIDSLPITALMQASKIHDMEGASSAVTFGNVPSFSLDMFMSESPSGALSIYDEVVICSNSFRIMRHMVNSWIRDVAHNKNVYADYQIVHFYRWIRSHKAYLYDPIHKKILNVLMKKLFLRIFSELEKLGCHIIYADFTKFVIHTGKKSVIDALSYTDYIVQTIRTKEIFHGIHFSYQESWSFLLWLNDNNYAGVKIKLPSNINEETITDKQNTFTLEMNWAISEYLPNDECKIEFENILSSFIEFLTEGKLPEESLHDLSYMLYETVQKLHKSSDEIGQKSALGLINTVVKALSGEKNLSEKVNNSNNSASFFQMIFKQINYLLRSFTLSRLSLGYRMLFRNYGSSN